MAVCIDSNSDRFLFFVLCRVGCHRSDVAVFCFIQAGAAFYLVRKISEDGEGGGGGAI
jgi:hypothetical protein